MTHDVIPLKVILRMFTNIHRVEYILSNIRVNEIETETQNLITRTRMKKESA